MSQFVVFTNTGPSGTGPVQTLTGNDGLAVVPTAGGTINVVGDGITLSTARNGANTLLISLNNTTATTLTTNDGAFHTIIPYALAGTGEAAAVNGTIVGTRFDGGNVYTAACGGPFSFIARSVAGSGVATLIDQSVTPSTDSSTGNATFQVSASGLNINIQVRGEAGQTWHWSALINFILL